MTEWRRDDRVGGWGEMTEWGKEREIEEKGKCAKVQTTGTKTTDWDSRKKKKECEERPQSWEIHGAE